jgi:hypothetical protein
MERVGSVRKLVAKVALTGALVAVPAIGLAGVASAQPGYAPGPQQPGNHGHYQPGGPREGLGNAMPGGLNVTPGDYIPPRDQWHHPYYPPTGYRDLPNAPLYPFGGYPPAIWWSVLQAVGLA